jgi:hypothetical protein
MVMAQLQAVCTSAVASMGFLRGCPSQSFHRWGEVSQQDQAKAMTRQATQGPGLAAISSPGGHSAALQASKNSRQIVQVAATRLFQGFIVGVLEAL